jgi:Coenzyme PQQ synthesis protein D (PqqD)
MMPTSITTETIVRRKPDALFAAAGGDVVLMSIEQGKYLGLDDIGTEIWQLMEQPIAVRALCAALAEKFDGEPAVIERDVSALLDQLISFAMVESQTS